MDVNKAKLFLQTVENGSLLATAEKTGYTQAGLTHMMKSIENELGVTLLRRGKFGVRLTEEGEKLQPLFRELVEAHYRIEKEAGVIRQQKDSVIRLAAVASVMRTWLPDVISSFQKQYPEFSFEIKEGEHNMYKWFDDGDLDLCITCNIVNREEFVPLMRDNFFACLPPDYPIEDGEPFPLKKLEEDEYISASCGEDYDIQMQLAQYGIHPKKQNTFVDDASVISMVSRGLGISLIPSLVLQSSRASVKIVPLDHPCYRRIGMIHRKPQDMSRAVKQFVAFLENWDFGDFKIKEK